MLALPELGKMEEGTELPLPDDTVDWYLLNSVTVTVGLGWELYMGDIYEVKDYTLNYSKDGPSPDYFVN